tara:strand:+ start:408 stop:1148 length:741 start_codon:yes stop_codon:yes gene_type:complete
MPLRATVEFVQATAQDYRIRSQSFDNPFYFDVVTLSEVVGVTFLTGRADNFSFTELQQFNVNKPFAESFGFTETFVNEIAYARAFTDSTTLGDVINSINAGLSKAETLALNELINVELNISTIQETITIGDVLGALVARPVVDNFSFSDLIDAQSQPNKFDGVAINETHIKNLSKGDADALSFADSQILTYSYAFADAFGLDDTAQVDKDYIGFKENVFGFSDTISIDSTFGRALGGMVLGSKQFN